MCHHLLTVTSAWSVRLIIGLSYERPYLVLDPNSFMISWFARVCKPAVYTCQPAVYNCQLVVYNCQLAVDNLWFHVCVIRCKPVVYTCQLAVYNCQLVVYTCKVLNFRFTAPILITVLDTVEVTPFFWSFVWKTLLGPGPKLHHDFYRFSLVM